MKNTIQIALIILLSVFLFNQCRQSAQFQATINNNELAKADTIEYYVNAIGLEVAEKQTYKGTYNDLHRYIDEQDDVFKEASKGWQKKYNALQIKLEFVLDSIDVPFHTPVPYNFERTFEKLTKDYALKGIANQNGLNIDFRAKAAVTSFTGVKPFSSQVTTSLTSSTDLLRISNFDNFSFVNEQKKWGIGISFGFGFYYKSIFTGVSVNRNFIMF